jgi:RecA/RadA recombinase
VTELGTAGGAVRGQLSDLFGEIEAGKRTAAQTLTTIDSLKSGTAALGSTAGGTTSVVGRLTGGISAFAGGVAAAATPLTLLATAFYTVHEAANSDTFLRWASTGDDVFARALRWSYGLHELTDEQYATAAAARASAEAFDEQGGALGRVAASMQRFKDQTRDSALQVTALDKLLREARANAPSALTLIQSPDAMASQLATMKRIADAARAEQSRGTILTPDLAALVADMEAVKEAGKDAQKAIRDAAREAEQAARTSAREAAAQVKRVTEANVRALKEGVSDVAREFERLGEYWERQDRAIEELVAKFDGTKLAQEANLWIDALERAGGLQVLSKEQIADGNRLLNEGIQAAIRAKQEVPAAWFAIEAATADNVGSLKEWLATAKLLTPELKRLSEAMIPPNIEPLDTSAIFGHPEWVEQLGESLKRQALDDEVRRIAEQTERWRDSVRDTAAAFREVGDEAGPLGTIFGTLASINEQFASGKQGNIIAGLQQIAAEGATARDVVSGVMQLAAGFAQVAAGARRMEEVIKTGSRSDRIAGGMAQGAQMGMAFGPYGAVVGAAWGAIAGALSDPAEQGRELARAWSAEMVATFDATATEAQRLTGGLNNLTKIQTLVIDAYEDLGLTGVDAMRDLDAVQQGASKSAEDVARALKRVNELLERQAQLREALDERDDFKRDILNQAVERYQISFDAAGLGFQKGNLGERGEELVLFRDALIESGMEQSAVLTAMAGDISALAADTKRAGLALPNELRDSVAQLIEMGLLRDEHGNAYQNVDQFRFSDELKPFWENQLAKMDIVIAELRRIPTEVFHPVTATSWYTGATAHQRITDTGGILPTADDVRDLQRRAEPQTMHEGGTVEAHVAHSGWYVNNLGRDEVPVIAQTGEGILNRGATARIGGRAAIDELNAGGSIGAGGSGGGGETFNVYGEVHVHGVQNPREFAAMLKKVARYNVDGVTSNVGLQ